MEKILILALMALTACGQTKGKQALAPTAPAPASKRATVGSPCILSGGYSLMVGEDGLRHTYRANGTVEWTYPAAEIWDCKDGKWFHDTDEEVRQKKHTVLVDATRGVVTTRKLTAAEVAVVFDATDHSPRFYGGSFSCSGSDCMDVIYCNAEGQRTADLIAQVSFWRPTEDELPLSLLQSFVKGMSCSLATRHAYEIINGRIVTYLQQRYP